MIPHLSIRRLPHLAAPLPLATAIIATSELSFGDPSQPHPEEIESWRKAPLERRKSEEGWLTLFGLLRLKAAANSLGGDPSSDLVFASCPLPPRQDRLAASIEAGERESSRPHP